MDPNLIEQLCKGVEAGEQEEDHYRKIEKTLAPFLRTLKKRKKIRADVIAEEHKELYLKRSPKELLNRLHSAFVDPLSSKTIMNETAELLKVVTDSKTVNLYLADYSRREIILCPKHYGGYDRLQRRYPIEVGTYVAPYVACTKEYIISSDILFDERFPQGVPSGGFTVKSVMCIPIITNLNEDCIGILECFRDTLQEPFNLINLQICTALTAWMGIAMDQNTARLLMYKQMEISNSISLLADLYFSGGITFSKILSDILKITKGAVNAEKGAVYVFHQPIPANTEEVLMADAYEEGMDDTGTSVLFKKRNKVRFVHKEPGIAGYVARLGEVVNIHDAYKDDRFSKEETFHNFRTRAVVAFPIKNDYGVLAVIKLINCLDYPYFRQEEVDLVKSYMNFVGLICGHYLLDTAYQKTRLKLIQTNKLLDYHTKSAIEDMTALKAFATIEQQLHPNFLTFEFEGAPVEEEGIKCIIHILFTYESLEQIFEFTNLVDFLFRVKKSYRPVLYHNFEHAFYVFHFVFNMISRNKNSFTVGEVISILLCALCHDIDHTGLTNSFLSLKNDNAYKLYGDFCGEAHRYDLTMFLIQSTELLSNVSPQTYQSVSKSLKRLMLAFDMAIHFQNRFKILELVNNNSFDWEEQDQRHLLHNMMLIVSDYCHNFKNFETAKKYTSSFYKELYRQGDLEKSMGFTPLALMDRNKIDFIPENQVILLSVVCMPCVEVVVTLLPNLYNILELLSQTLGRWNETMAMRGREMWRISAALIKDRREKKSHRVTLSSTLSSIRTVVSDAKSRRYH